MKELVKYIGMDVHKAMTVIVVLDAAGQTLAGNVGIARLGLGAISNRE